MITADLIQGEAWVWVHDSGLGISEEHQRGLFTKFFRGDAARKRGISGTGLGLVLARQIVEAHDGSIGFDSEEGSGSTFWICSTDTGGMPAAKPLFNSLIKAFAIIA